MSMDFNKELNEFFEDVEKNNKRIKLLLDLSFDGELGDLTLPELNVGEIKYAFNKMFNPKVETYHRPIKNENKIF